MNLQHVRYFLAVTRAGGFTQAARALHVTQPTVSSGIAELERHLGVKLFNRNGRSVELTLEGRTFLGYALQLEDVLVELEDKLHRPGVPAGEGFRFGAIDAAVIYLLPELLKAYLRDWPQVNLAIQVDPSRYLVEELLVNRSEFALISLPFEHPRLQTLVLLNDAMPLVVGAEHPFAGRERVRPDEVVREPLILFHADSVSRKIVDEHFAELGLAPRVVMEMRSPEAMRKLVEAGVGISFLPRMVVEESLASGVLREVSVRGMKFDRQIGLAWRRGRHFGPAIRHLLEAILNRYGKLSAWQEQLKKSGG